ncbi:MAG: 23S rRNA (pseudouridine(1915)-N(3))-methyltransferase RlmH [Gemmatimonadota bacterium]
MELTIAAVGKLRNRNLAGLVHEYERRIRHYYRLRIVEVPSASKGDPEARRAVEGETLQAAVPKQARLWALTRRGEGMTSRRLAWHLEQSATYGGQDLAFLIGGAHGLPDSILRRADVRLSLSPMTVPHELARLLLTEQLYRAGTLLRGEPYHKEP